MQSTLQRPRRAAAGVGVLFATNGAIFAALLPWYPTIAARLQLSATEFGFIVASFAAGAIVSSALPAPLIARFGPVRVAVLGTGGLAVAVAAAGWAPTGWAFALALFAAGLCDAVVDVAQNVAGIRVQDRLGRPILSSMHALWSLGGVLSGAAATASAAAGVDLRLQLAVVAAGCVALVALGGAMIEHLADNPERPVLDDHAGLPRSQRWRGVVRAALPLVVIAVCGTIVEDVANNWAAMSGVQLAGLAPATAGLAFTLTIGSQCVGRFTGDLMIARLGRTTTGRLGGLLIALGGLLILTAAGPAQLFAGLAAAGFGSATLVPSALSAAARIPGVSEGAGVTIVSWLLRLGFLGTSPVVGSLADTVGLRWGLGVLVLAGAAAALLAGALDRGGVRPSGEGG